MSFRTDRNHNPAAFTTDIAKEAGLTLGVDYKQGEVFTVPSGGGPMTLYTAYLLGDPIALTIRVIDAVGYYTNQGRARWSYVSIPKFVWASLTPDLKKQMVGFHYLHEGGTELQALFA